MLGGEARRLQVAGEMIIVMCPRDDLPRSPGTGHTVRTFTQQAASEDLICSSICRGYRLLKCAARCLCLLYLYNRIQSSRSFLRAQLDTDRVPDTRQCQTIAWKRIPILIYSTLPEIKLISSIAMSVRLSMLCVAQRPQGWAAREVDPDIAVSNGDRILPLQLTPH